MAEGPEAGKPAPVASLERALDQVLDFLGRAEHVPRARALAIEARRLRTIVGKWRSIEPPEDVREEMITRVLRLASDAEEAVAETAPAGASAQAMPRHGSVPRLPAHVEPPQVTPPPRIDDATVRMPQIPDLDAGDADAAGGPPTIPRQAPAPERGPRPFTPPSLIIPSPVAGAAGAHRVPSLQFERVVPPPGQEILDAEIIDDSVPPERFQRGQGGGSFTVEPAPAEPPAGPAAAPERQEAPEGPPSLLLELPSTSGAARGQAALPPEPLEPPYSLREAETAMFTLPSGIKDLQPISVVPAQRPAALDPNLVMITDPYSERADAYRALRRKLAAGTARIIAVTSAKPKEGKTICALNLAYALAESSPRNILVVEANIRSPGLAAAMKIDPQICFTEQLRRLRKDEDEPWVVVDQSGTGPTDEASGAPSTRGGSVHLLAVDPKAERPPMLDAVAFSKGMESLKRAGYEYIIVDTPAVLGALDMQIIGDAVDGVIFTSIVKRSARRPLKDAIEQIRPAPVLGVILLEG